MSLRKSSFSYVVSIYFLLMTEAKKYYLHARRENAQNIAKPLKRCRGLTFSKHLFWWTDIPGGLTYEKIYAGVKNIFEKCLANKGGKNSSVEITWSWKCFTEKAWFCLFATVYNSPTTKDHSFQNCQKRRGILKSDPHFLIFFYLIQWKPLKMMKNAFYFIIKDKIYDITTCLTNNYNTHINTHISRSKSNQTIKLGQLIEYHKRNTFLYSSRPLFIIFNPWKVQWNWIAFSQNSFVISPGLLHHVSPD